MTSLSPDNKLGLWMCNILATKPLRGRERRFIASVMQHILRNPLTFQLSVKQRDWLQGIWCKHGKGFVEGTNPGRSETNATK